jgi:hypothetical protein
MQGSWRNGSRTELITGRKTCKSRRREKKENCNSLSNRPRSSEKLQFKRFRVKLGKCLEESTSLNTNLDRLELSPMLHTRRTQMKRFSRWPELLTLKNKVLLAFQEPLRSLQCLEA